MYHKKLILDEKGAHVDPSTGSGEVYQSGDMKFASVANGRVRSIAFANLRIRGKFSWLSPFSTPFAEASNVDNKQVIGPDGGNPKTRKGFSALAIEDIWYVQIDTDKTAELPDGSQAIDLVVLVSNPMGGSQAVDNAVKKARSRISEFKLDQAEVERTKPMGKPERRDKQEPAAVEKEIVVDASAWLLGKPTSTGAVDAKKPSSDREEKKRMKLRSAKSDKAEKEIKPNEGIPPERLL